MNTSTYSPLTDIVFQAQENMYHEVYVLDRALDIIYVNGASLRNYGLYPHEMVGQNRSAFGGRYFFPGNIPNLVEAISNRVLEQVTSTGRRILSMSTPVEDENGELSMLVTLTEEPLSSIDLLLAKDEKTGRYEISTAGNVFPENTGQEIVAESPSMRHVLSVARQAAKKDFPILIQGESGTGKSMLAEYIHKIGGRSGGPFYSINCAAIPEQLLQSELFGYSSLASVDRCLKRGSVISRRGMRK